MIFLSLHCSRLTNAVGPIVFVPYILKKNLTIFQLSPFCEHVGKKEHSSEQQLYFSYQRTQTVKSEKLLFYLDEYVNIHDNIG